MKMMKVLVALLVMAGLVAPAVAIAEDKLSISGEFRVFGFSKENYSDFDDSNKADETDYFNQRLRLYSKYAVTEGVTIHTRMDFGEGTWGAVGQNSIRQENNNDLQIDRAFLEIDKETFNLRAGQQYYGFGNSIAVDHQGTGFRVSTKSPVVFTAFFNKLDENGLTDDDGSEDVDMYGASLKYKADNFAAELFYAFQDGTVDEDLTVAGIEDFFQFDANEDGDKSVIGLAVDTKLGAVNVKGELNIFDGEVYEDTAKEDAEGLQLYLDANTAISGALTLGGSFFYAQGYDDKLQLAELSDFGSWLPWEYGYFETNYGLYGSGSVFNPLNVNAGTLSLMGYGAYKASDNLGFKVSVQYAQEEEDSIVEYDYMSYNLSANYTIAKNTNVFAQFNYLDVDADLVGFGDLDADAAMGFAAGLQANF